MKTDLVILTPAPGTDSECFRLGLDAYRARTGRLDSIYKLIEQADLLAFSKEGYGGGEVVVIDRLAEAAPGITAERDAMLLDAYRAARRILAES